MWRQRQSEAKRCTTLVTNKLKFVLWYFVRALEKTVCFSSIKQLSNTNNSVSVSAWDSGSVCASHKRHVKTHCARLQQSGVHARLLALLPDEMSIKWQTCFKDKISKNRPGSCASRSGVHRTGSSSAPYPKRMQLKNSRNMRKNGSRSTRRQVTRYGNCAVANVLTQFRGIVHSKRNSTSIASSVH